MDTAPASATTKYHCGPGYGTRGERAYTFRKEGKSWDEIAILLDANSADAVLGVARKYARMKGLLWPVEKVKIEKEPTGPSDLDMCREAQQRAYEMRLHGKSWQEITDSITVVDDEGNTTPYYSASSHTIAGARRYALREGKPWPVRPAN